MGKIRESCKYSKVQHILMLDDSINVPQQTASAAPRVRFCNHKLHPPPQSRWCTATLHPGTLQPGAQTGDAAASSSDLSPSCACPGYLGPGPWSGRDHSESSFFWFAWNHTSLKQLIWNVYLGNYNSNTPYKTKNLKFMGHNLIGWRPS